MPKQRTLGTTLRFIGRDLKRNVKRNVAKNNLKRLPNHNVSNSGKTNMKWLKEILSIDSVNRMNNNNEVIEELTKRVNELESDNHQLQEEVDETKQDILKLQEVVQRLHDDLQMALNDINEIKNKNKSDDDY